MADVDGNGFDDRTGEKVYTPGGATQAASAGTRWVYWGETGRNPNKQDRVGAALGVPADPALQRKPWSVDYKRVEGYLYGLAQNDPKLLGQYQRRMIAAGVLDPDNASFAEMQKVWLDALDASSTAWMTSGGATKLTPWDAIDLLGAGGKGKGSARGGAQAPFSGTKTQSVNRTSTESSTNRRVDLSSASEARAFLLQAAERELGRAATADEIKAFRRALNGEEKNNAEVSTTKGTTKTTGSQSTTYKDGDATASSDNTNTTSTSNTTETGGMDRGQYALDYARSAGDYAEYQAATTYMQTLFASLGSPTDVGTN